MKLASFRLRIALLSVALAGGALVGFGLVAWRLIYVAKVSSLDAKLDGQLQRLALARSPDGWQDFARELPRELEAQINTPMIVLLVDSDGQTQHYLVEEAQLGTVTLDIRSLLRTKAEEIADRQAKAIAEEASRGTLRKNARQVFSPNNQEAGNWRIGVVSDTLGQGAIAVSLQTIDQDMAVIRNIFLLAIPSTLLMIAAGAWVLSGSALKPVRKLTRVIQQVTATGLDQQVPIGSADVEFVELIEVFNEMLVRLERSFKQSSRFSGDAAHELKTPLAILRGELELAMQQAEPGSALQQSLSHLMDEVSRLSTIVRKLLLLSLADAGQMSLRQEPVDVGEILTVLVEDIELLAPDLPVKVDVEKGLKLKGDGDLFTQVLQNLIDNAIKYNLPEGSADRWLSVTGRLDNDQVKITVANASRKLSAEDRDRIFDRFYRGDLSRNRKREGFGLGLSLSREIARAHKGNLQLDNTAAGETAFTLTLPALPALPSSGQKNTRKLTVRKA
ncbi:MAG: ATP-binding protein [Cyanobacteria bacterium J06559_1]